MADEENSEKEGKVLGCSTLLAGFPLDDKGYFNFDLARPPKYMDIRRFIVSRSANPVPHNRYDSGP